MNELIADSLRDDPRVKEAVSLLKKASAEHQAKLTDVRAADPEREASYERMIQSMGELRGGGLYYPYLGSGAGSGALVELADGSVKYDMISGIGVHWLGHSHPAALEASLRAALGDTVMQGNLQQNVESLRLVESVLALANGSGAKLAHAYLTSSGATANENGLKIAFQHRAGADRLLAFGRCFAGRTLALAQVTDNAAYRQGLPATIEVDYVPFFDEARPEQSTEEAVRALRSHLTRHPGGHAAMIMELVQGEGGYNVGSREFFIALIDTLKAEGVTIFFDEIQTFGRTTRPFAFQHFGLDEYADIVTIGKMSHVCATIYRDELRPGRGLISQTYTSSTAAIFMALAIIDEMNGGDYFGEQGKNMRVHERFAARIAAMHADRPDWIHEARGIGAMIAFQVFDGSAERTNAFLDALFKAGVIAFPCGSSPRRVRFLPPIAALADADIAAVCNIIGETLERAAATAEGA